MGVRFQLESLSAFDWNRCPLCVGTCTPAATFIAHNYNSPVDARVFDEEAKRILAAFDLECGWMYTTLHRPEGRYTDDVWHQLVQEHANGISSCNTVDEVRAYLKKIRPSIPLGAIEFTVWSDVLLCPQCGNDIVFFDAAFDPTTGHVSDTFTCQLCRTEATKRGCARKTLTVFDSALGVSRLVPAQVSVRVSYRSGNVRNEKIVDEFDRAIARLCDELPITQPFPIIQLPYMHMTHERASMAAKGITHVHHFHSARSLKALAFLWSEVQLESDIRLRSFLYFTLDQAIWGLSKLARYVPTHFSQVNQYLNGVYYLGALQAEVSPRYILDGKIKRLKAAFSEFLPDVGSIVNTASCAIPLSIPESVDYIFTDPPFGENIYYADLNFLVESWHGVVTDSTPEAIVDKAKKKALPEYQELMTSCFRAYYEVLKPARWMTVEFSNSSNAVWNAIQEALEKVGFVIADIRILDKQSGSFRQVTAASAVKQDLVISCYKPSKRFIREFSGRKGTTEGVREFIAQHLDMLPVAPLNKAGHLENLTERTLSILYERMVGYHLVQGARIPLSVQEFGRFLSDEFFEEDGMWFLPNQLAQYQARKMRGVDVEQLSIFIQDERSAVRWIRTQLQQDAKKEGDLNPLFMKELKEWPAYEARPELRDLLRENFIASADGYWAIPDPENEAHLLELTRAKRLSVFRGYSQETGRLFPFKKEVVIEGFKHCWQTKQYGVIVRICERMRPVDLQGDRELMQFYDIAKDMAPQDGSGQLEFVWE